MAKPDEDRNSDLPQTDKSVPPANSHARAELAHKSKTPDTGCLHCGGSVESDVGPD